MQYAILRGARGYAVDTICRYRKANKIISPSANCMNSTGSNGSYNCRRRSTTIGETNNCRKRKRILKSVICVRTIDEATLAADLVYAVSILTRPWEIRRTATPLRVEALNSERKRHYYYNEIRPTLALQCAHSRRIDASHLSLSCAPC